MTRVRVEIVFATPEHQHREWIEGEAGMTVGEAIRRSSLAWALDDPAGAPAQVGVFGRLRSRSDAALDGDRIEIYRALIADPKASRRRRAARQGLRGGARQD